MEAGEKGWRKIEGLIRLEKISISGKKVKS